MRLCPSLLCNCQTKKECIVSGSISYYPGGIGSIHFRKNTKQLIFSRGFGLRVLPGIEPLICLLLGQTVTELPGSVPGSSVNKTKDSHFAPFLFLGQMVLDNFLLIQLVIESLSCR